MIVSSFISAFTRANACLDGVTEAVTNDLADIQDQFISQKRVCDAEEPPEIAVKGWVPETANVLERRVWVGAGAGQWLSNLSIDLGWMANVMTFSYALGQGVASDSAFAVSCLGALGMYAGILGNVLAYSVRGGVADRIETRAKEREYGVWRESVKLLPDLLSEIDDFLDHKRLDAATAGEFVRLFSLLDFFLDAEVFPDFSRTSRNLFGPGMRGAYLSPQVKEVSRELAQKLAVRMEELAQIWAIARDGTKPGTADLRAALYGEVAAYAPLLSAELLCPDRDAYSFRLRTLLQEMPKIPLTSPEIPR